MLHRMLVDGASILHQSVKFFNIQSPQIPSCWFRSASAADTWLLHTSSAGRVLFKNAHLARGGTGWLPCHCSAQRLIAASSSAKRRRCSLHSPSEELAFRTELESRDGIASFSRMGGTLHEKSFQKMLPASAGPQLCSACSITGTRKVNHRPKLLRAEL